MRSILSLKSEFNVMVQFYDVDFIIMIHKGFQKITSLGFHFNYLNIFIFTNKTFFLFEVSIFRNEIKIKTS